MEFVNNKMSTNEDILCEKEKKCPKDMDDDEITQYIQESGCEPSQECKFVYNPMSPYFRRFSYGTFTNCTIPPISMCFTDKSSKIIRCAEFTNVDFGKCLFIHVIFYQCFFENCNFSNTIIRHLTFEQCIIKNTNVAFENVVVK
jgi:hypothetical protein